MHSTDPRLSDQDRATLLEIAGASIDSGLDHGEPLEVDPARYPPALSRLAATFVTLHLRGELRGCIGTLEARWPLVRDVAEHAYAAAFDDPRFPRLTPAERDVLSIHVSVLGTPEMLPCRTEQDLLSALRPGVDGLILKEGDHRATFLPTVWTQLEDPFVFVNQLKYKAALPLDYWSETIKFYRYTTESFPE